MFKRYAIYYAPALEDPLWRRATAWLGGEVAGIERGLIDANSVSARRYGFHATIKAPMALAAGTRREELEMVLGAFAARTAPVVIGRLRAALIEGFLALIPVAQTEELTRFAGAVVMEFDRFRAPMGAAERARRTGGGGLSARQLELLDQYGYPYVLEEFRFHMTLTDRLDEALRGPMLAAAEAHFAPVLEREMVLDRLVVYGEPEAGGPFVRLDEFRLMGSQK